MKLPPCCLALRVPEAARPEARRELSTVLLSHGPHVTQLTYRKRFVGGVIVAALL